MADTKLVAGGVPNHSTALVSADQVTILGNGTAEDPLRASDAPPESGSTYVAAFRGGTPFPGMPVRVSPVSVAGGVTTVQQATADVSSIGQFTTGQQVSTVDGVVKSVNEDGTVVVQESGILTLTAGEWDVITGGSGGLALSSSYYLPFGGSDALSDTPPLFPGAYSSRVGVGLNETDMLLSVGSTPTSRYDYLLASFSGGGAALGRAVYVQSAPGGVPNVALGANSAQATAQVVGLLVDLDTASIGHTVQLTGVVELSTATWDAVKGGSGGLTPGAAYYLATGGGLALAAAITGSGTRIAQVGVALSATRLFLTTPVVTTGSLAIP